MTRQRPVSRINAALERVGTTFNQRDAAALAKASRGRPVDDPEPEDRGARPAQDGVDYSGWLTLAEVAQLLGLKSKESLYTTVRRGTLPAVRKDGRIIVDPAEAEKYRTRHSYTRRSAPGGEA